MDSYLTQRTCRIGRSLAAHHLGASQPLPLPTKSSSPSQPQPVKTSIRAMAKHAKRKGEGVGPHQAAMKVNLDDGHRHIDGHHERGDPGQQANDQQHAAKEFGKSGNIAQPDRQVQCG